MHKKIFVRSFLTLAVSYLMLTGVLFYQNASTDAGRRNSVVSPGCIPGLRRINTGGRCRSANVVNGFREVNYECNNGGKGELRSRGCVAYDSLKQAADYSCSRLSNCTVSPTPTEQILSSVTPTPTADQVSPTPCAMPTQPLCENGSVLVSDETQTPGVCGPRFVCILNSDATPSSEL